MAVSDAPVTTYSDTTAHKRQITDLVSIIDPMDTPVVAFLGLEGDTASKFKVVNSKSTKIEWLEDDYAALAGVVSDGSGFDSTITTFSVTDGTLYKKGYVVKVDSERMWVSSVSTNTLTVTRNFGGTQASHADAATINIVNMARLEGATATDDYKTDVTAGYNYTQILQAGVKASGTVNEIAQWGISANEFEYQSAKKVPELTRLMELAFFYGDRASGSATAPRGMGGIETFVTDNTISQASAALTEKAINDLAEDCFNDGGQPDLIIVAPFLKRKVSSLYQDTIRTERTEQYGGAVINYITTEFGEMKMLMSRHCPPDKLYMVQSEKIGFMPFRSFFWKPLAITGDFERAEVIGEYTLIVANDKAHGFIKSISSTS